jgi:cell division protein FtsZ
MESEMSINIGPPAIEELRPRITVIGVGGAGGNAIANMINAQIEGVDFVVANTDAQALNSSVAENRIQLGTDITQGLGAGARPEVGRAAAEESLPEIERALEGVHMCFIAAGMGGGTGTGAAPVIAEAARRKGVLTVGVVTKPFLFEGTRRMRAAESGIEELQKHVDTLIVIPNQNLFLVAKADTTFKEAFNMADEVLQQGVRSITDLMVMPGLINLDFADVRSVMGEMGKAMMGTGEGEGENRALTAAEKAIANPLLDGVSMQGAKGVIISIIGGDDMKLLEVDEAANHIRELVDPNANIIWGSAFNPDLQGKIRVSVVATGIEQAADHVAEAPRTMGLGAGRGVVRPAAAPMAAPAAAAAPAGIQPLFDRRPAAPQPAPEPEPLDLGEALEADEPAAAPAIPVAYEEEAPKGASSAPGEPSYFDDWDEDEGEDAGSSAGYASLADVAPSDRLDLGDEDLAEDELADDGASGGDRGGVDELLLDAGRLAEEDAPVSQGGLPGRRRGLVSDQGDEGGAPAARPAASGATLFERMASLSRGAAKPADDDEEEEGGSSISIPRFLNRQNNQ